MNDSNEGRWLLLIHQLPPKPDYFRVKIWRRLQRLGAVAIKNSVYVLPKNDQTQEDFQWVLREIVEGGGDASLCEARFVEGLSDDQVEALFQVARGAEYDQIVEEARRLAEIPVPDGQIEGTRRTQSEVDLARLKRRLAEVVAIDFFGAPGREAAEGLVSGVDARMRDKRLGKETGNVTATRREDLQGKTKGAHGERKHHNHVFSWEIGDKSGTDAAFRNAEVTIKELISYQRVHPCPLETCQCVASFDKIKGELTVWGTFQAPHVIRTVASLISKIPEHKIHVIAPDIGGGFGNKVGAYPGYICAIVASIVTGRPE